MESATDTRAPTPSPADVPQLYEQLLAEYVSAMKVTGDESGSKIFSQRFPVMCPTRPFARRAALCCQRFMDSTRPRYQRWLSGVAFLRFISNGYTCWGVSPHWQPPSSAFWVSQNW